MAVLVCGVALGWTLLRPSPDAARFAPYRTTFAAGERGWSEFRDLALDAPTDIGPSLNVLVLITALDSATPNVYFIPSKGQAQHWDFAHAVLRWEAMAFTRQTFIWATFARSDRRQLAVSLVRYPERTVRVDGVAHAIHGPLTLQFNAGDKPSADEIRITHDLLTTRMPMLGGAPLLYVPTTVFEERRLAEDGSALKAAGIAWIGQSDLYACVTFQSLNPGTSYGTLRAVDAAALAAGSVGDRDILILDQLPLDLPLVGGTISEALQTPLAHINVLARTRRTPNMALLGAGTDARVAPFIGKLVRFDVDADGFRIVPATVAEAESFWAQRRMAAPVSLRVDLAVAGIRTLDEIGFGDAPAFGVKAANLAELHRLIPEIAPGGLAVPISAYEDHLRRVRVEADDCPRLRAACEADGEEIDGEGGNDIDARGACGRAEAVCSDVVRSSPPPDLRAYIAAILARDDLQSDGPLRAALLHGVRTAIESQPLDPGFAERLRATVAATYADRGVRLRSSTNAEDLEGFSGAGLYDSVTAYASGDEKPVEAQIRRVWASVWGVRAFDERVWWGIPHLDVRMGVLVNRAYPDEQCNGVLVTADHAAPGTPGATGMVANIQAGENAVTNPTEGTIPEIIALAPTTSGWETIRRQFSSLSPDRALMTDAEIDRLADAAARAHAHFSALYDKPADAIAFEMEFKVHGPERELVIKQIRTY